MSSREGSDGPRDARTGTAASPWPAEARVPVGEPLADRDEARRFGHFYEVGKRLLSSSVDELNELALSLAFETVNAERGALLLRDEASGELVATSQRRRDDRPVSADPLAVPTSIVREAVEGRVGILTTDALHDPRFEARASVQLSSVRSALCAPLWNGERVLGVIYLDSRIRSYAFTRDDLLFLNALASLIAIRLNQEAIHAQLLEERIVRSNLERYHSPDVAEAILANLDAQGRPRTGLEEREVTVLFIDLEGFTGTAEKEPPARIAEFLDAYYDMVTRVVFSRGGTINDYLGDGVMAVFGAPVAHADHAARALDAGRTMLRELRDSDRLRSHAFGGAARVGINSGSVMVGSVGAADRLKYTVIGDAVNVASRLQGIAEPGTITLSGETRRRLGPEVSCVPLGSRTLRGRSSPVEVYCVRA